MAEVETWRTFLALTCACPVPLARVLKQLGQLGSALKCASPRDLHCTLRFLGETPVDSISALGESITNAVSGLPAFTAEVRGIGAFPDADRPRVIWAGLQAPALRNLSKAVESVAAEFGFTPDRLPFRPHITLARVKRRPPSDLRRLLQEHASTEFGQIEFQKVELFRSTLLPAGPKYEVLAIANLKS